jgi:hypothetical protein
LIIKTLTINTKEKVKGFSFSIVEKHLTTIGMGQKNVIYRPHHHHPTLNVCCHIMTMKTIDLAK